MAGSGKDACDVCFVITSSLPDIAHLNIFFPLGENTCLYKYAMNVCIVIDAWLSFTFIYLYGR